MAKDCVSEGESRTRATGHLVAQDSVIVLGIERPPVGAHFEVHSPNDSKRAKHLSRIK